MDVDVVGVEISDIKARVVTFLIKILAKHIHPNMVSCKDHSFFRLIVFSLMQNTVFWDSLSGEILFSFEEGAEGACHQGTNSDCCYGWEGSFQRQQNRILWLLLNQLFKNLHPITLIF